MHHEWVLRLSRAIHCVLTLSCTMVQTHLQCTTVGKLREYWSMCSRTRWRKLMRSSVVWGTPWSGQAVKWNCRTERISAVLTWGSQGSKNSGWSHGWGVRKHSLVAFRTTLENVVSLAGPVLTFFTSKSRMVQSSSTMLEVVVTDILSKCLDFWGQYSSHLTW